MKREQGIPRGKNRRGIVVVALAMCAQMCVAGRATAQGREEEVVANLATGRALFCVTKEGIVVATVHSPAPSADPGARAPAVVELPGGRIAILLGAVEWV